MDDKREEKLNNNNSDSAQPVRSFGVQNMNSSGAEDIKERIDSSRKTNLNNDTKTTSKDTEFNESTNSLPKKDGLEENGSSLNPKNLAKGAMGALGNAALNKAKQDDSIVGDMARTGSNLYNTAKTIKNAQAKGKAIVTFLKTPLGHIFLMIGIGLIGLLVIIALAAVLSNPFQLIISSIGMKFGLSGEYSYEASTRTDEEYNYYYNNEDRIYEEGMTRTEVEEMINSAKDENGNDIKCKLSFFQKVKNFLGIYDLSDPCEYIRYFKNRLEYYEKIYNIPNIAPGYIMNTFYYSFETQNYKLSGEPFITEYIDETAETDEREVKEITSDLDAINFMFGHKRADGTRIFYRFDIDDLISEEYVFHWYYKYWKWEKVSEDPEEWECKPYTDSSYEIDVDKYKIFLRYGRNVSIGFDDVPNKRDNKTRKTMPDNGNRGYEADKNILKGYEKTDSECKETYMNYYKELPSSLEIYKIKAYPDAVGDDGAVINLATGSYEYKDGYIFTRYPRYMPEFTVSGQVNFDYIVAKEIEKFIDHISDRQDYANYLLGYESDVGNLVGTKGNGSTSEIVCDYTDLEGANVGSTDTNLQVQLTFPDKSAFTFNNFDFESNADMEGQLISLEKYVLGAVYMEAGGEYGQADYFVTSVETTTKAFSIMVRSFVLAAGSSNGSTIRIANSTQRQTYCDPDEGCYVCPATNNSNNVIVMPIDSELAKNAPNCIKKDPLPQNSPLREYVKATAGQVMTDSSGKVALTQYDTTKLSDWHTDQSLANYDYAEILYYLYGDQGFELNGVECEVITSGGGGTDIASGPWDSWKQCGPWGDQPFGRDGTLCRIGCLITSYSKLIADANPSTLKIPNFNPQTFTQALNANNCFSGNDLLNYCALDTAVGTGNYTYNSGSLTGTFENKRSQVESFLNQGYYVIISVKSDGHWVYVTGTTANDILMSDPASSHGNSNSVFNTYGNTSTSYKIIKFT